MSDSDSDSDSVDSGSEDYDEEGINLLYDGSAPAGELVTGGDSYAKYAESQGAGHLTPPGSKIERRHRRLARLQWMLSVAASVENYVAASSTAAESNSTSTVAPTAIASESLQSEPSFVLPDDPTRCIEVNNEFRSHGSIAGDVWPLDSIVADLSRPYKYVAPTFAPTNWRVPEKVIGQDAYNAAFNTKYPIMEAMGPIDNVVIAGGAAAMPFYEKGVTANDVDIFIHGIDPMNSKALWTKCDEVLSRLTQAIYDVARKNKTGCVVSQTMIPGLITINVSERSRQSIAMAETLKIQVILRAYSSISAILHAFDIPSACVAFDGRVTHLTTLGAFAHAFRANIVEPSYRSTTYESRLLKYFDRGFALVLPRLKIGAFAKGVPLRLPHIVLTPAVVSRRFAVGTISLEGGDVHDPIPVSDYDNYAIASHVRLSARMANRSFYQINYVNIRAIITGGPLVMFRALISDSHGRFSTNGVKFGLPIDLFAKYGPPTVEHLLSRNAFMKKINKTCSLNIKGDGSNIPYELLRNTLGFSTEQLLALTSSVVSLSLTKQSTLSLSTALAPFHEAIVRKYNARAAVPIEWWIVSDPGRQYTASQNPRMENPVEWYGLDFLSAEAAVAPTPDEYIEAMVCSMEVRAGAASGRIWDETCTLCLMPCRMGSVNVIVLNCGHLFHWSHSPGGDCDGLSKWLSSQVETEGKNRCPTCREPFGDFHNYDCDCRRCTRALLRRVSTKPLVVDWGHLAPPAEVENAGKPGGHDDNQDDEQDEHDDEPVNRDQ